MCKTLRSRIVPALIGLISLLALKPASASPNGAAAVAVSPDGARLYVARAMIRSNRLVSAVSVIDTATLQVVATFSPKRNAFLYSLAVSPDSSRLYLAEYGAVAVIDAHSLAVLATIKAGPLPVSLAASRDGRRLYAANADLNPIDPNHPLHPDGGLTIIDSAANQPVTTLDIGRQNRYVAVSPDGRRLYVITSQGEGSNARPHSTLQVIDAGTLQVVSTLAPGLSFDHGALSPDGQRLYITANTPTGWDSRIEVYDTATNRVIEEVKITDGKYVFAVQPVVSPDGKRVYLTMANDDGAIRVMDTQTLQLTGTLKLPGGTEQLAISPDGKRLYSVAGPGDGVTVTVIDTDTLLPGATAKLDALTPNPP